MTRPANTLMAHASGGAPTVLDLFKSTDMPAALHRPIPAPEPNPEPNPGPDAARRSRNNGHSTIAPADWDELFHAVQVRLEQCAGDALHQAPELALYDRHDVIKKTVLECVDALKQLHAALAQERQHRQGQPQQYQADQQQAH